MPGTLTLASSSARAPTTCLCGSAAILVIIGIAVDGLHEDALRKDGRRTPIVVGGALNICIVRDRPRTGRVARSDVNRGVGDWAWLGPNRGLQRPFTYCCIGVQLSGTVFVSFSNLTSFEDIAGAA